MLQDQTVFIEILAPYAANNKQESYIAHNAFQDPSGAPTNAVKMNIQPAGAQMTLLVEGSIGKTFTGFTAASGIVETMRVTVSGTAEQYIVKGRQYYNIGIPHSELIMFKRDPQ
jgi:hypothetical protein